MFGRRKRAASLRLAENTYESLYEAHGAALSDTDAVGDGSFNVIGMIELGLLQMKGLRPTDTVVDFGCGTGRLAVPLVHHVPSPPCSLSWVKQTTADFRLEDDSLDVMCAFSVFTHMEHEDAFRYLESARRVVRPGGKFIFSCLPLEYTVAREIFVESARQPLHARWSGVRNVTTSRDLMEAISELAGWTVVRWYSGNADNIEVGDELLALGQSSCVLQRPS